MANETLMSHILASTGSIVASFHPEASMAATNDFRGKWQTKLLVHTGRVLRRAACLVPLFLGAHAMAAELVQMKVTAYDDGKSCPESCDAHVVFHRSHNGTRVARMSASDSGNPTPCISGRSCMLCFPAADSDPQCIDVVYRGNGPPRGRFDFTPAFFSKTCATSGIPAPIKAQCKVLAESARYLAQRINCISEPNLPQCTALMRAARMRKALDDRYYDQCIKVGENAFNKKYSSNPELHRVHRCAYAMNVWKTSSDGSSRWRILLDGACRPGSYVGRNGLDCCSGEVTRDAIDRTECSVFYPHKQQ